MGKQNSFDAQKRSTKHALDVMVLCGIANSYFSHKAKKGEPTTAATSLCFHFFLRISCQQHFITQFGCHELHRQSVDYHRCVRDRLQRMMETLLLEESYYRWYLMRVGQKAGQVVQQGQQQEHRATFRLLGRLGNRNRHRSRMLVRMGLHHKAHSQGHKGRILDRTLGRTPQVVEDRSTSGLEQCPQFLEPTRVRSSRRRSLHPIHGDGGADPSHRRGESRHRPNRLRRDDGA